MKLFLKKYLFHLMITLCFGLFLSGCISNILKEKIPTFSDEINFTPPAGFKELKSVYPSWKNANTQNVILIISNCDDGKYSSNYAHMMISENVESPKIENSSVKPFNFPKQVTKRILGFVNEEPVEIQTLSFKHNNCVYITGLSGKPSAISKDVDHWKSFLKSIELKK